MSIRKAGIFVFSVIIMLVIVLVTVRGISVSRKSSNSDGKDSSSVSEGVDLTVGSPVTAGSRENNIGVEGEPFVPVIPSAGEGRLVEVDGLPELGSSVSVSALVSSRKVYFDGVSYLYCLVLLVPRGSDEGYSMVNYYCSRKVFDAVDSGSSVRVDCSFDGDGVISVNSISK